MLGLGQEPEHWDTGGVFGMRHKVIIWGPKTGRGQMSSASRRQKEWVRAAGLAEAQLPGCTGWKLEQVPGSGSASKSGLVSAGCVSTLDSSLWRRPSIHPVAWNQVGGLLKEVWKPRSAVVSLRTSPSPEQHLCQRERVWPSRGNTGRVHRPPGEQFGWSHRTLEVSDMLDFPGLSSRFWASKKHISSLVRHKTRSAVKGEVSTPQAYLGLKVEAIKLPRGTCPLLARMALTHVLPGAHTWGRSWPLLSARGHCVLSALHRGWGRTLCSMLLLYWALYSYLPLTQRAFAARFFT